MVALSGVMTLQMKKEAPKRYEPPKKQQNSSHNQREKTLKRRKKWKTKSIRKVSQLKNGNKILYFYFLYMEKDIFARKQNLGKCSFYYYISSKGFQCSRILCTGFVDIILWPKILGNILDILTSILIATDYFFRCQKSNFNLKNNKCICQIYFLQTT